MFCSFVFASHALICQLSLACNILVQECVAEMRHSPQSCIHPVPSDLLHMTDEWGKGDLEKNTLSGAVMSLALLLTVYPCFSCLLLYVKLHMCLLKPSPVTLAVTNGRMRKCSVMPGCLLCLREMVHSQ